jgi:hypothetical protein
MSKSTLIVLIYRSHRRLHVVYIYKTKVLRMLMQRINLLIYDTDDTEYFDVPFSYSCHKL